MVMKTRPEPSPDFFDSIQKVPGIFFGFTSQSIMGGHTANALWSGGSSGSLHARFYVQKLHLFVKRQARVFYLAFQNQELLFPK